MSKHHDQLALTVADDVKLSPSVIRSVNAAMDFVGNRVGSLYVRFTDRIDGLPYIAIVEQRAVVYVAKESARD